MVEGTKKGKKPEHIVAVLVRKYFEIVRVVFTTRARRFVEADVTGKR